MNQPKCPRARTSFAKLDQPLPVPNLIDIQRASWKWFLESGLKETIEDISPIRDYSEKLLVEFGESMIIDRADQNVPVGQWRVAVGDVVDIDATVALVARLPDSVSPFANPLPPTV